MSTFRLFPPLLTKALVMGALIVLLIIPLAQLESLVGERVSSRQVAMQRVAESWGGPQTTAGVLLAIPVEQARVVYGGQTEVQKQVLYVLPDTLSVKASASPTYRTVGLYRTPVYLAEVEITGQFVPGDYARETAAAERRVVRWDAARLLVLNSESRSLRAVDGLEVAGTQGTVSADGYAGFAGVSTPVPAGAVQGTAPIPFRVTLSLAGSSQLRFLPLARKADIDLRSTWQHPKYEGAPAPLDPQGDAQGFSARWSVLEINRSFGQSWVGTEVRPQLPAEIALSQNTVGVSFYEPVDVYQRNYRAVHYALLLIVITFLTFFLWEHVSGQRIHAMQYLMVGLALAMFYLLLLALSEHLVFDLAYGISAAALVTLIVVYLSGVLRSLRRGLGAGAGLATLYTMLYWILRSEDYSLLMGALLLFAVLALLMITTRRFDWAVPGVKSGEGV